MEYERDSESDLDLEVEFSSHIALVAVTVGFLVRKKNN